MFKGQLMSCYKLKLRFRQGDNFKNFMQEGFYSTFPLPAIKLKRAVRGLLLKSTHALVVVVSL